MRCLLLIGLKQCCGNNIIDIPKVAHIYKSYPHNAIVNLYGKGISYTRILNDPEMDRTDILRRIRNKEFEFIIYGLCHRGMPLYKQGQKDISRKKHYPYLWRRYS